MADVYVNALTTISTEPTTTDSIVAVNRNTNEGKIIDYNKLADVILNKLTSKQYSGLNTTSKLLVGAVNELDSDVSSLDSELTRKNIATGIEGVSAEKYGRIVILRVIATSPITLSSAGWATVGTLPSEVRPISQIYGVFYDNNASSHATNTLIDGRIQNNGDVAFYLFNDKLSVKPMGFFVYISAT